MSRAQKLVNWAKEILQRHSSTNGLNDQKALAELRKLFEDSEPDDGRGTASDQVKLAKDTLQRHMDNGLNDHQAMTKLYGILEKPKADGQR
jgi:hypothetical protein